VFVVIGRNEGARLAACLRSLRPITNRIVYADSCSSDGSPDLAKRLGAIVVPIDSPPLNAARGRNEGLSAALAVYPQSEFVQFLDGDCILQPDWPRVAIDFLDANSRVAAVCGRRFEAFPDTSIYNRLADQEWNTPIGPARACGGDSMMRVAAVLSAGSFDPQLMAGEEPELCSRLRAGGWEIRRLDRLMTEHDAAILRFSQWWRRTVRSGFGYAQTWLKTRRSPEPLGARQLRSAFLWIALLPSFVILATLVFASAKLLLLLPFGYIIQVVRIAWRTKGSARLRLAAGALLMLAKTAELVGAIRYLTSKSYKKSIEYKDLRL
jgi:glycosyltransferase involved in cell wall biosynthesis